MNCKNSNDACSVVWMGSNAKDAKITQRACWTESETSDPKCHVGACVPEQLQVSATVGYFCCCRGDLCNKNPEEIKSDPTTEAPKCKNSPVPCPSPSPHLPPLISRPACPVERQFAPDGHLQRHPPLCGPGRHQSAPGSSLPHPSEATPPSPPLP